MGKGAKKRHKKHDSEPLLLKECQSSESCESDSTSNSDYEETDNAIKTNPSKSHRDSCKCQEGYIKIKKSSMKHVIVSKKSCWNTDELTLRCQKIEMQLSNAQMEESINVDRHNILQVKFDRIESIMQSVLLYLECLELEERACYRLCHQLNGLIVNEKSIVVTENLSQVVKRLCEGTVLEEYYAIKDNIRTSLETSKELDELIMDYNEKKRDYNTASQNFKLLLQNANLNMTQLEKLQRQFDGILLGFQHSRCMLDQELPDIISARMKVLLSSFNELGSDLQKIASDRTDLSSLLKHLEASLRNCNDLVAIKGNLHEVPLVEGAIICSNCSRSPAIAGDNNSTGVN